MQFTIASTVAVLDKLECMQEGAVARYGPGGFCWMSTVGDLSAMHDEIDPAPACDKAEEAISHLTECVVYHWEIRDTTALRVALGVVVVSRQLHLDRQCRCYPSQ